MRLFDVMADLGAALEAVDGLRVLPYTERRVNPPQVMVALPRTYAYDATMGRGSDDLLMPVIVFVGQPDAESSQRHLSAYVDGAGATSVKEAIEKYPPTAYDFAVVQDVQFLVMAVASVDYLTATFRVRIVGKGS